MQVAIYNLKLQKLARTIRPHHSQIGQDTNQIIDFGMSGGLNKLLFVICGPVDPTLTVYKWYSGKAIGSMRDCGVLRAVFEPATDLLLAISDNAVMTFSLGHDVLQRTIMYEVKDVRPGPSA